MERQSMAVDIACVGLRPGDGRLPHDALAPARRARTKPPLESAASPGLPLQVVCYERADDPGFGVSGVVTRARGIRAAFPDLDASQIPMAAPGEAGEGPLPPRPGRRLAPLAPRSAPPTPPSAPRGFALRHEEHAVELPYTPAFLHKHDGFVFSMGQLMQWMSGQVLSTGTVQIWPATPGRRGARRGARR